MIRGAIGVICMAGAVLICTEKVRLLGYDWYVTASALFCVGAFFLWAEWQQWRERRSLWGTRKTRPDFMQDEMGSNVDLFPDD